MADQEYRELKTSFDDIKNLFETQFKTAVEKGETERKEFGDQLGLTKEALAKMEARFVKHDEANEKWQGEKKEHEERTKALEEALSKLQRPAKGSPEGESKGLDPSLAKCFSGEDHWGKFIRRGDEKMHVDESKSLATSDDSSGGFFLPQNRAAGIIELNVLISPIRQLASVETISTGDALEFPKEGSTVFATAATSEKASRTETTSGTFAMDRIPVHEVYANPFATQKMIDDAAFGIEQYISRKVAQQFAKTEGAWFCTGTGVQQPEGIAATTNGVGVQVCTATGAFTAALLMDLQYLLEEPYASNATWVAKRVSFGKIRQLTGNEGFLWQPGISADKGPTLLGQPYVSANDVATIVSASAGDRVIYFGDFQAGYKIVDRMGISLLRDPYSNKPFIEFMHTKRVGGQVVLPEAIKIGTVNS